MVSGQHFWFNFFQKGHTKDRNEAFDDHNRQMCGDHQAGHFKKALFGKHEAAAHQNGTQKVESRRTDNSP